MASKKTKSIKEPSELITESEPQVDRGELISKILYIKGNIDGMSHDENKDILQIILNSNIDDKKIQEKNTGTQVKFKDLKESVICDIYNYMNRKIKEKLDHLATVTTENQTTNE